MMMPTGLYDPPFVTMPMPVPLAIAQHMMMSGQYPGSYMHPQQQIPLPPQHHAGDVSPKRSGGRRRPVERTPEDEIWEGATGKHDSDENEPMTAHSQRMADDLLTELKDPQKKQQCLMRFHSLAFSSQTSSRAAQNALRDATKAEAILLAEGLQGSVLKAAQSKHANHVVAKVLEALAGEDADFVVVELLGNANDISRHMYGCRVMCRIIENANWQREEKREHSTATHQLFDEILSQCWKHCNHPYGSYVIRKIVEWGLPKHKHDIAEAVVPRIADLAKHKLGSLVVEAALVNCSAQDQSAMVDALLADEGLQPVAKNQFGKHVVTALLLCAPGPRQKVCEALYKIESQLSKSKAGKSVLQRLHQVAPRPST
jgi:hypothetical protein